MKKLTSLLLVLVLICTTVSSVASAEEKDLLARIQDRGTILIATEGDWAPWTYHDEEDALTGLDVEIGRLIAEGLGVEAVFQETDWDSILAGVDSGRFDLACNGVTYTEERAEKYSFSTPYVYMNTVLAVRGDNTDILTVEDLAGRKTANSPSSIYASIAEEQGASVTYVSTLGETMALLEQGRVDATINAKGSVEDYLKEHPESTVKIVQELPGESIAFPVRKDADTASLLAAIDDILDAARQDGTLASISEKFFGADLTRSEDEQNP